MPPTQQRILAEALRLFSTRGFEGTTVTEIEAAAGLAAGSGSFYRHFKSKEDVLRAVVDDLCAQATAETVERDHARPADHLDGAPIDERARLRREFVEALDGLSSARPLILLLTRLHGQFPELERRIYHATLDGWIRNGALLGGDPSVDSRGLATVVTSAVIGYHLAQDFFGRAPADVDRDEFVDTLVDIVVSCEPRARGVQSSGALT